MGLNKVIFSENHPKEKENIFIVTKLTRTIGPISYVEGKVQSKDSGEVYCAAQIKIFSN